PLASCTDRQTQIRTLRLAPRFRPGVHGADLSAKIAALPENTRERLLELLASKSGVDGMDLAVRLAKVDASPKIQEGVVQALLFRRADRHIADLMSAAHDETWTLIARRGYAEDVRDPSIAGRLRAELQKAIAQ